MLARAFRDCISAFIAHVNIISLFCFRDKKWKFIEISYLVCCGYGRHSFVRELTLKLKTNTNGRL